jgi:P22 coat protein - gene protein 5
MPNTFITPTVIARVGLATLYNNLVLAGLVWRDFDPDFTGKQGDTINVRKPAVFTANDFSRASGIVMQDVTEGSVPVVLNKLADVSFPVTSEELTLKIDDFANRLLVPAMLAIGQKVDTNIALALIAAATGAGGGGTVSMTSVASDAMVHARERLTRKMLPTTERYGVLSPEGTSAALLDPLFVQAQMAGTTDALRNANVGRAFGIDTYESGQLGSGPGAAGQTDGVAFHRTAVTLASRTLQAPNGVAPNQYAIENFQGLALRVVQQYDIKYKQDVVSVDFLYGIAATRPEGAVVVDLHQGS